MPETLLPAGWVNIDLPRVHYFDEDSVRSLCGQISRIKPPTGPDDPMNHCGTCSNYLVFRKQRKEKRDRRKLKGAHKSG